MTSLVMIYVYFDKNGDIKAITPVQTDDLATEFNSTTLPLPEVEAFLLGQKNPFDYTIRKSYTSSGDPRFTLTKKYSANNITRSLDNYLTKVSETGAKTAVIQIISNPNTNKITLLLNKDYKALQDDGTIEERESVNDFADSGPSTIYITKKNDPYRLIYTLTFIPKMLLDEIRLDFTCPDYVDLRNSSAYTKRLVGSYVYAIRETRNVV